MEEVADRVRAKLANDHKDDINMDITDRFNIATAIIYSNGQIFPLHRDQRYDSIGQFIEDQNCQKRDSPVAILALGDTRILKFQLMRHQTREDKKTQKLVKMQSEYASMEFELKQVHYSC